MPELYPDDEALLNLVQDGDTGIEYIPTGKTPYYLEFRKLVQRIILAAHLSNELRPYQDGTLTIGLRAGRVLINGTAIAFSGATNLSLTNNATNNIYVDNTGQVVVTTQPLPADRSSHVPIATVTTSGGGVDDILDLRGELSLSAPYPPELSTVQYLHEGILSASESGKLLGAVPVNARIVDVSLSVGSNLDSDLSSDGVTARVMVNGTNVATTDPSITDADGTGFKSTAQGAGTAAVIKTDGTETVAAGDILTVDIVRSVGGTVTSEASEIAVSIVFLPDRNG